MKTIKNISLLTLILFTLCACSKDKLTSSDVNGTRWIEVDQANFTGSNHTFEFFDDNNFTLELRHWTDIASLEPCSGNHTDFIRGTFLIDSDQLTLVGKFTDDTFEDETPGCFGQTDYSEVYPFEYDGDDWILNNDAEEEYLWIRLVEE